MRTSARKGIDFGNTCAKGRSVTTPRGNTQQHRAVVGALLTAVLITLSACNGSADVKVDPATTPSPTLVTVTPSVTTPTPTDPDAAVKATILKQYALFWKSVEQALNTDEVPPSLFQTAGDAQAAKVIERMTIASGKAEISKGTLRFTSMTVTSINAKRTTATVTSCGDSSQWRVYDKKSGKPKNPTPPPNYKHVDTMQLISGTWKFTSGRAVGTC